MDALLRISAVTIVAFAGFLATGGYAFASNAPDTTNSSIQDNLDQVECKAGKAPLGSRLPGPRECHTQREWNEIQQQSQDALSHTQVQSTHGCPQSVAGCFGG
jgi:DNA-binding IscR family transcriptional regulator